MGWLIRVALGVVAVAILPSCGGSTKGGDDDPRAGSCDSATACGGDVVGAWTISSSCLDLPEEQMAESAGCPGTTGRLTDWSVTGSITFMDDLGYSSTTTLSGNVIVTLPASCLTQQGITLSCAQVQDSLESSLAGSDFSSARCAVSSGKGCACTLSLLPMSSSVSGTYTTTAEGVLTQTQAGGRSSSSDFCVEGSTMTLSPEEMGMDNLSGSFTLTKQ